MNEKKLMQCVAGIAGVGLTVLLPMGGAYAADKALWVKIVVASIESET